MKKLMVDLSDDLSKIGIDSAILLVLCSDPHWTMNRVVNGIRTCFVENGTVTDETIVRPPTITEAIVMANEAVRRFEQDDLLVKIKKQARLPLIRGVV